MNLDHLKYMIEVSKNDFNITKTASKLYISQPSLSQAIQKFELDCGYEIFERNNGRLFGLTENGKIILEEGKLLIDHLDKFVQLVESLENRFTTIKIGISTPLLEIIFNSTIWPIIDHYGLKKIAIIEKTNSQLETMFTNKEIDILFTLKENRLSFFDSFSTEIIHLPYNAVMDKSHPFSEKEFIRWEDLNNASIIVPPKGYVTEKLLTSKLKEHRIKPKKIINIVSIKIIEKLIHDSDNIAILPSIFLDEQNTLLYKPLEEKMDWTLEMLVNLDFFNKDNYIYNTYIDIVKLLRENCDLQ